MARFLQSTRGAANRLLSQREVDCCRGWNGDAMLCQGHDDLVPDLPCLALGMPRTIFVETISVGVGRMCSPRVRGEQPCEHGDQTPLGN